MICPNCKSTSRVLLKRKPIVKLIPGTKSYTCTDCNTDYTWFRFIKKALKV